MENSENINSENKETAMEVDVKPVAEIKAVAKTGENEMPDKKEKEIPVNEIMVRKKEKPPKDPSQTSTNDQSKMVVSEIQTMKQTSDLTAQPIAIKRK